MYTEKKDTDGTLTGVNHPGGYIPCGAYGWDAYLDWLAAGNTPTPDPEWTLANVKLRRIAQINEEATLRITAKWPLWLQSNIALGLDPLLAQSCKDGIAAVRVASNIASELVNSAADVPAVKAVVVNWPVI